MSRDMLSAIQIAAIAEGIALMFMVAAAYAAVWLRRVG